MEVAERRLRRAADVAMPACLKVTYLRAHYTRRHAALVLDPDAQQQIYEEPCEFAKSVLHYTKAVFVYATANMKLYSKAHAPED
jgi:hypothetical protein